MLWALLVGVAGSLAGGCITGVHHHHIQSTVNADNHSAEVTGTVSGVDVGVMADFRFARVGLPYEGQRHQLEVQVQDGRRFEDDNVFEMRTFQLDVPLWSLRDFSEEPTGHRYPGLMPRRHSLELWVSGQAGVTPVDTAAATLSAVYYRYGGIAARVYAGASWIPYSGLGSTSEGGFTRLERREGHAMGVVFGLEMTLAAGEYGLELVQFVLDLDQSARDAADRWQ